MALADENMSAVKTNSFPSFETKTNKQTNSLELKDEPALPTNQQTSKCNVKDSSGLTKQADGRRKISRKLTLSPALSR